MVETIQDSDNSLKRKTKMSNSFFEFRQFRVEQGDTAMKVGTDGTLLGAWAQGGDKILDIGTGTGLIALMMAQRFPLAQLTAVEIDKAACRQAAENFSASPFSSRLSIVESSIQDFALRHSDVIDLRIYNSIVCNPPYFLDSLQCPDKQRSLARHASSLHFEELFHCVSMLLTDCGVFSVIIPSEVLSSFDSAARIEGFRCIRKCAVKTVERKCPRRYLLSYSRDITGEYEETTECLDGGDGKRSEWYTRLTKDFYVR